MKLYFDEIVLGRSSTLTKLVFSSFEKPFPAVFEVRLARLVAERLG